MIDSIDDDNKCEKVYLTINELSQKTYLEKEKIANKLHCQFGHSSSDKLQKLLRSAKIEDKVLSL